MDPLRMVGLRRSMALTEGRPEIVVGLIDGPVDFSHPDLCSSQVRKIPAVSQENCAIEQSVACLHGTYVGGILFARRRAAAPAICPGCTVVVRPVFSEEAFKTAQMPSTTVEELTSAIVDCVEAGALVVNISAAPEQPSSIAEREIEQALDYARKRGVLIVAAAGNQGTVGSSPITRHPWTISVSACDLNGRPMGYSNLGASIALNGLSAPGAEISTLAPNGNTARFSGTSAAAPFVTGAAALLWSLYPKASSAAVRSSLAPRFRGGRASIVPRVLNAQAANQTLSDGLGRLS